VPSTKEIEDLQKGIEDNLSNSYKNTYFSDPATNKTLSYMRNRVHKGIDKLVSNTFSNTGLTNISALYSKANLLDSQSDDDVIRGINSTLENESIMSSIMQTYSQNTYLRDMDREIDMVLKYMPKLADALDCRREHVFSADNMTKTFLNIRSKSGRGAKESISNNVQEMRMKYDLEQFIEDVYRDTDKYGEAFVYCVPYKKAIRKLLDSKNGIMGVSEDGLNIPTPSKLVNEAFSVGIDNKKEVVFESIDYAELMRPDNSNSGLSIEINKSGVIETLLADRTKANNILLETANLSVNESDENKFEMDNQTKHPLTVDNALKTDGLSQDGVSLDHKSSKNGEVKIPGCVCKMLDHTMVKPLYIDDICLGYFYIECDKHFDLEHTTFSSTLGGIRPGGMYKGNMGHNTLGYEDTQEQLLLKRISEKISQKIDASFVNANQDLSKEIYAILKYNSTVNAAGKITKMRVSFIPPEDMIHSYFELDRVSHRGISGLAKSLFPAKLYSCLYISNTIQILTRGNDKRVYYVKQQVDTNIAGVLLSTINQIQRSNFGLRQIESMNNVLNMLGRFNDLMIPKSPSGDAPVDMEVIPGQNVDVKTDLMNALEEMAVNATDVPIEVITSRFQVDYATRLTMTNSRFLGKILNRQAKEKLIEDKIITRIYNAEFDANEQLEVIPNVPMYLAMLNTDQIINSINNNAQNLANTYVNAEAEQGLGEEFQRVFKQHYGGQFFTNDDMQEILTEARLNLKKNQASEDQGQV
jgi:hypothetical protein